MTATLLTFGFLTAAVFTSVIIAASLARGWAAAGILRRELAVCPIERTVMVHSFPTSARIGTWRPITPARAARRPGRPTSVPAPRLQRAAA